MPSITLLKDYADKHFGMTAEEHLRKEKRLRCFFAENEIVVEKDIISYHGPSVSEYRVFPAPGTKGSKIKELADVIALATGVVSARVWSHQDSIAIEIPNDQRSIVPLKGLIRSSAFRNSQAELPLAIGQNFVQETKVIDLADAPHILIAGTSETENTVCMNTIVISLLYSKRPQELKMVFIDPKNEGFSIYKSLMNRYLAVLPDSVNGAKGQPNPIASNFSEAADMLDGLCLEMEERFAMLAKANVGSIKEYNNLKGWSLPYLVCFISEYADLTMAGGNNKAYSRRILSAIIKLAQKGQAVGIHLIIATQRSSADVITGLIKTNLPTRIAFRTGSIIDSMIILDEPGAEKLIGAGDLLLEQGPNLERIQGAYIGEDEVKAVVDQIGFERSFRTPFKTDADRECLKTNKTGADSNN